MSPLAKPLAIALVIYVVATYAIGFAVQRRVEDAEDYLVAGRRLSMPLAFATLLATWFGAGTMLTAADEVRRGGLRMAALEPVGAGLCLVLAGVFFAERLWNMKLLTLGDFFARRYGPRAEVLSAIVMIPGYFGWIAVQFIALAGMLELMVGLPMKVGIATVALVGMGYTLLGGMWAVTMTDALQLALLALGLLILGYNVLDHLGSGELAAGIARLEAETPSAKLIFVPRESRGAFIRWLGVILVASLGNLPGQDLLQRIFAAKDAATARRACTLAGTAYVLLGAIPVLLGLAADLLVPGAVDKAVLPALASGFLSPALAFVFAFALASAVLSTIDSALLSPSAVFAQNVLPHLLGKRGEKALSDNRWAVVAVTAISLTVAYVGESAYELLETAYEIGFVGLFVPLAMGTFTVPRREASALAAMLAGAAVWGAHLILDWETFLGPHLSVALPPSLVAVAFGFAAFVVSEKTAPTPAPAAP
ncbi:MAG: sodium:solute symporter family protein [Polyangiaceae bacterium]